MFLLLFHSTLCHNLLLLPLSHVHDGTLGEEIHNRDQQEQYENHHPDTSDCHTDDITNPHFVLLRVVYVS